jgi:hypothetical protein
MARTSFTGPVYSGGKPVVTQDQSTGELVGLIPIVYPALANAVTQNPTTKELVAPFPIVYPVSKLILEGEFRDNALQIGGPTADVPRTVLYGPGGTTLTGIASVAANGVISILKDAGIVATTRLRAQRSGAAGVSALVIWGEVSIDGGINWTQLPNVGMVSLSTATDIASFYDVIPARVLVGQKYRIRFARSSAGNNSGDLAPLVLPGGLSFLGTVPSAYLSIYRFE